MLCVRWRDERKIQLRMWKNEEIHVGFWKVTGRKSEFVVSQWTVGKFATNFTKWRVYIEKESFSLPKKKEN